MARVNLLYLEYFSCLMHPLIFSLSPPRGPEPCLRTSWRDDNNLSLNVSKTKGLIVDYKKRRAEQAPINIDRAEVEQVESSKILGVHITNKLSWSKHTNTIVKRAQQNLSPSGDWQYLAWVPKSSKTSTAAPSRASWGCITAWYGNCWASDHKALQRVVRTA